MAQDSVKAVPLASMNSAAVVAGYTPLNAGLPKACFLIRIVNASNQAITISYDGVTDHEYLLPDNTLQVNSQTNAQPNNQKALFPAFTPVYIKGVAGVGIIYMSGYYT